MDPVEALKHIRPLLKVASESGDIAAIERHVAMAQTIIEKALPSARAARREKAAPASERPVSPLAKILDEPRIGLGNEQNAMRQAKKSETKLGNRTLPIEWHSR